LSAQLNHEQLMPLFRWFEAQMGVDVRAGPRPFVGPPTHEVPNADNLKAILGFLQMADVGIVDIRMTPDETFELRHQMSGKEGWLPLAEESQGTRRTFYLAPLFLTLLQRGGVLVIDELEASLHPLVAAELVRTFQDPLKNKNNAQILFTTHDTLLLGTQLGEPVLRRDQIWLSEKDDQGVTDLFPMTDFKPRKGENLEKGYLQGRYDATPFIVPVAAIGKP